MRVSGVMDVRTLRKLLRFRIEAIPGAAIRNQGAPGVLLAIRMGLCELRLVRFVVETQAAFQAQLDTVTDALVAKMPADAQHWGTTRKALNLFLRDCTYDHHLRRAYGLAKMERWLEVPVDGDVAHQLSAEREGRGLRRWRGLKHLEPADSVEYQAAAQCVADRMRVFRVDLDLYWWRWKRRGKALWQEEVM